VIAQGINSRPTVDHMTCIFSPNGPGTATHEPGIGMRLREGIFPTISNSVVIGSFAANDQTATNDNYCLRIDNRSQQAALDGDLTLQSVIWSCAERTRGQTFPDATTTEESFAIAQGNVFATVASGTALSPISSAASGLQLLEGTPPYYSLAWSAAQVDGAAPANSTQPTTASRAFLGAVSMSETDWTKPWAYGLDPANRGSALWIE
jgi:hypothetical protein